MKKIVIFGAGGHAHIIADIVETEGNNVCAFLDDNPSISDRNGNIADYLKYPDCEFIIGIGNTETREKLSKLNLSWHTAIHPTAVISKSAEIGEGTVIMPNAVVNARAKIGKHCIINTGAIVEHDNYIDDYSHISVGVNVGGTVCIGKRTWIGIGATIINNISICDDVFVGAGATVVQSINQKGLYLGVPAKQCKKQQKDD